ncbi:hypothetical protein NB636_06750 [Oxalobacter aliiformigenes]|uniref:hypothetical protein n=1 Tax=Oxalobacter aliiformigenes TaxID=2946593 RepID=UPI0022AF5A2B|nr:hypothetical protein [Oxalobacter aliiformigenes]MCZ4065350.1 hypothetical protein [Oxalobacter aliiformigenes]WAV98429.1 hypothetical protein NB636_06750 [Oxalobacter aliiformigenes]
MSLPLSGCCPFPSRQPFQDHPARCTFIETGGIASVDEFHQGNIATPLPPQIDPPGKNFHPGGNPIRSFFFRKAVSTLTRFQQNIRLIRQPLIHRTFRLSRILKRPEPRSGQPFLIRQTGLQTSVHDISRFIRKQHNVRRNQPSCFRKRL